MVTVHEQKPYKSTNLFAYAFFCLMKEGETLAHAGRGVAVLSVVKGGVIEAKR